MSESRYTLRAAAARLPYSTLAWLAEQETCPPMHRAEARREMRRTRKREAQWFAGFLRRLAE